MPNYTQLLKNLSLGASIVTGSTLVASAIKEKEQKDKQEIDTLKAENQALRSELDHTQDVMSFMTTIESCQSSSRCREFMSAFFKRNAGRTTEAMARDATNNLISRPNMENFVQSEQNVQNGSRSYKDLSSIAFK